MIIDYIVLIVYMVVIVSIGLKYSGTSGVKDYFLGNRSVPWLMVCFSIVATETSTLTFLSIPGVAYIKGFSFIQMTYGYLIGRIIVSIVLLPKYFKGNYETAYHFLQNRFGSFTRVLMSVIFHITRLLADSIRLFSTAIPLAYLLNCDYWVAILIVALVTFIYTFYGGIKSVIIVDTIQLVIYLVCAIAGIFVIFKFMDKSFYEIYVMIPKEKINLFSLIPGKSWTSVFKNYNLISGIIGGAFFSFASHGIDHLITQRLLSCKNVYEGKKALITSGLLIIVQTMLFLTLGIFIFVYLNGKTFSMPDEIMPHFIINHLPAGLRGLMLAGIFAAAMSSLSSSINSLSASTAIDILKIEEKNISEKVKMKYSRLISLTWTLVLVLIALCLTDNKSPLVELGLGVAGITYGAMLGIYILAILKIKLQSSIIMTSVIAGIFTIVILKYQYKLFWPWFVLIGSTMTTLVAVVINYVLKFYLKNFYTKNI